MTVQLVKTVADFSTSIVSKLTVGATTGTLSSNLDLDGVALPNGVYGFTIDRKNSNKEFFTATVTGTALTNIATIARGTGIATSGLLREHRKGAEVIITDFVAIRRMNDILETSFGGTVDASSIAKGIAYLSVDPAVSSNPKAVGDNDPRVPSVDASSITANKLAALAGTGTPNGTTGKYVTNDDTGTSGANKVLRLDGGGLLPAVDGSQLTNAIKKFGSWSSPISSNSSYHATTDGFVIVNVSYFSSAGGYVTIKTDGNTTPTTVRMSSSTANNVGAYASIMCPVKNGDYVFVETGANFGGSIYWIPLTF